MRIGFVGGGSGGHFYPLVAVAYELNHSDAQPELFYFGPSPYDEAALTKYDIKWVKCPAGKLRRYFSIQNFFDLFRNFFGVFVAIWKLYVIYPDVIFSKGGYTSVPILVAAKFLRIPVVIHESDAIPGRANKLAMKQARYIGVAYDDAAQFFPQEKTALVGIPMRPEIKNIPTDPFSQLGIPNDKPLIYITGGSSGAERINNIVLRLLKDLLPHYRIFHQTGQANLDEMRLAAQSLLTGTGLEDSYYLEGLIPPETVSALMAAASLIITRAGSTTLFEIAYHAKPSIVIPIPEDVSRDQRSNAYAYGRSGAAVVMEEHNITEHLLANEIHTIISDPAKAAAMSQAAKGMFVDNAALKIANILISIGTEHGS
ncbi:MAG: UDP-N-acetylglucosamine--N-acetylmuramyl-(pentapeptide) pyrophosphoryl-undecaprenol N-acetylglucosamine transferase [Candidatus Kaiserbacteria bacterium]|nr:UDP-N-acetylglucosamine--N-acetylmuramyl-(pentapeptide) pyrophosphoryl-undecaprenol N-acetylglucosamine transferase [Candidatus Kaiserbacteria bacterium]MCB9816057.1 UDP-N-acetylglucosamine--N-acetylmuramyl-(pentapeptide) pyrophosphoryl-undecaprenol N-acetylglucosamine transferase [Candidatus Nomurabacteria bacterium]